MTPITIKEASEMLDMHYQTVNNASRKDTLTRMPTTGQEQHLIKEQVELFVGKKQISLRILSREERVLWEKYKYEAINAPIENDNKSDTSTSISIDYDKLAHSLLKALIEYYVVGEKVNPTLPLTKVAQ